VRAEWKSERKTILGALVAQSEAVNQSQEKEEATALRMFIFRSSARDPYRFFSMGVPFCGAILCVSFVWLCFVGIGFYVHMGLGQSQGLGSNKRQSNKVTTPT